MMMMMIIRSNRTKNDHAAMMNMMRVRSSRSWAEYAKDHENEKGWKSTRGSSSRSIRI
jgi:hypothetical protein